MKILQVNCVYNKGSTGKITADIHHYLLEHGVESVVCYGRGEKCEEPGVYKTCGEFYSHIQHFLANTTGVMYGGCWYSTRRLISIIKKEQPDVVHLQCINGYFVNIYRLITWLKKNHIKTVLTLHAEFMYTANCGHALECEKWKTGCGHCPRRKKETGSYFLDNTARSWRRMKKAFDGFEEDLTVIGVSKWIAERAAQSPLMVNKKINCIYNGIHLDNFETDVKEHEREYLEEKYGISSSRKIVLHVTPCFQSTIKGGEYFIALSQRLPEEYQAVVVGNSGEVPQCICSIPFTTDQKDLAAIYRAADVLVITSKADNYPTVSLEAQACGTPVVGFDVGGVAETIGAGLGAAVPAFDAEQLYQHVIYWANQKKYISVETIQSRALFCGKGRMGEDYFALYNS